MHEPRDGRRVTGESERRWPGARTAYAVLPPHDHETVTGPCQIGVAFSAHGDVAYRADGRSGTATYPGGSVICSGRDHIVWSEVREPTEALELYLDPELVATVGGHGACDHWWPVERSVIGRPDPVVVGIASVFRRAHATGDYLGDVAASTLVHRLAHHVTTQYATRPRPPGRAGAERRHAGLRDAELAVVHAMVEERLAETISLDDLAAGVHLSPFHFARAFTSTVGQSPHAYLTGRRMDRARLLLRTTGLRVDEVATRVGFHNLSHFRRVFAAHAGLTPAAYRAELAS